MVCGLQLPIAKKGFEGQPVLQTRLLDKIKKTPTKFFAISNALRKKYC
jgi:hypothetical protein